MIDDLKDRLDVWFRAHLQGIRSTVIVFGVVIGCALLSYFVTKCLSPYPSLPSAPPTIAPTVTETNAPATHVPSRTLSPTGTKVPPTETETKEATWTSESTATDTTTPTQTAAPLTATLTQTATTTPPMETIPAGRNLLTPPPLPNTGASEQEIAEMTPSATPQATVTPTPTPKRITLPEGCVYHSLYLEPGLGYDVLTFHCPTILDRVTPGAVGGMD